MDENGLTSTRHIPYGVGCCLFSPCAYQSLTDEYSSSPTLSFWLLTTVEGLGGILKL